VAGHGSVSGPGRFRPFRWEGPAGKAPDDLQPPEPDGCFRCSNCRRPLVAELVVRIEPERRWAAEGAGARRRRTGFVLVTHHCACSARVVMSRRRAGYDAYLALFGRGVRLPYVTPFVWAEVPDDDQRLERWRFELDLVESVDDFVLWVEAERRKPLDESRRRRRDSAAP
jgi:hypothetical protein